jgi:hypothetical protein
MLSLQFRMRFIECAHAELKRFRESSSLLVADGEAFGYKKKQSERTNVEESTQTIESGCSIILSASATIVWVSDESRFRHIRRKSSTALRLSLNLKRVLINATTSERCSKS